MGVTMLRQGGERVSVLRRMARYAAALLGTGGSVLFASVRVQPIQDCSQQPQITVLRDGKPAAGMTVDVYLTVEHPTSAHYQEKVGGTLRTDARGKVILPKLPRGIVHVMAHWKSGTITTPDLQADLWMQYFPEDPDPTDFFTMDLHPYPNERQYVEQTARAAEAEPVSERVQQLGGVVVDSSGAVLRDVSIEVAQLHVREMRAVRPLRTDAEGHFWALLPAGDYVAIFNLAGFQESAHTVMIDPAEKQSDMRIILRPGAVTE